MKDNAVMDNSSMVSCMISSSKDSNLGPKRDSMGNKPPQVQKTSYYSKSKSISDVSESTNSKIKNLREGKMDRKQKYAQFKHLRDSMHGGSLILDGLSEMDRDTEGLPQTINNIP